jgi:hypothetical protein
MSKLGDLIVRLKLQYEDYKKGLKNAANETNSFGGALGKLKGVGLAVWGAIGAGATAMANAFIKHSQTMGDKWNVGVNQMKAVWNQFLTSLTSWDWEGFGQRIKDAMTSATASTAAHDAEFEVTNSIKLRKAAMADELAQLQILTRDTRQSYADRAKAAEEYLNKVKPLYDAEIELRKRIYMTDTDEYLQNAGLKATADNRDLLRTFLTDVAPNENLVAILNEYQKKVQGKKNYKLSAEDYKALDAFYQKYGNNAGAALSVLAQYYQSTNDDVANKVVDAIVRYDSAIAQFNEETRKVQTVQNTALAQMAKEQGEATEEAVEKVERVALELPKIGKIVGQAVAMDIPDIIPDDWLERNREKIDEALAEALRLQGITDDINMMFENAVVGSLSGATQALTDCIAGIEGADASQVLAALLQPFASTMTQMGEMLIIEGAGIKAFKESLKSLNPAVAIGAGVALLALGAALSSGIKALGSSAGSSGTTASSSAVSNASVSSQEFKSEQTIYVKGKISGSDIVIAGDNQKNKWRK